MPTLYVIDTSLSPGYSSYLAYIQVEASHTNPILNVFAHLLMTQVESNRKSSYSRSLSATYPDTYILARNDNYTVPLVMNQLDRGGSNMARRRWYVAYTLLRNPKLIELRRSTENQETANVAITDRPRSIENEDNINA